DVQDRAVRRKVTRTVGHGAISAPNSRSASGDQVQLAGEGEVLGSLGDGPLQLQQSCGRTWLEIEQRGGHQVGEDPDAVAAADLEPGSLEQAGELLRGESVLAGPGLAGWGLGKRLLKDIIAAATSQEYHMMIGVIDSMNATSIRLHQQFGFVSCGLIRHAGYKFGRWLDVELYQLLLPTPSSLNEES
ncbi:MAG: GCN5-related N-acetyltransferase, partial [Verrucomicrobiaceae bacterium]|nr:GCN5-related N-acetyltransferase [Verrucomicrobiaceae bacterium]